MLVLRVVGKKEIGLTCTYMIPITRSIARVLLILVMMETPVGMMVACVHE